MIDYGRLLQNTQNSDSESEASLPESREGPESLSIIHHMLSPMKPPTPSDVKLSSSSSDSINLSSPEYDSSDKSSESSKSFQGEPPVRQKVSYKVKPHSQSMTTVESEQVQRECVLLSHSTTPVLHN